MKTSGFIVSNGEKYQWACEHNNFSSAWGIDGGRVVRVSVFKDGRICGVKARDYAGMPENPFVWTLIEALIERFSKEERNETGADS